MKIRDVLEEFREKPTESSSHSVLTLTEKNGFMRQEDRFNKRLALSDTSTYKVIRINDFAFNPYLLWAGAIAANFEFESGIISPLYPTFHVKPGVDPTFLKYLLLSPQMITAYDSISFGSVPRKRRSSVENFMKLDIGNLPPLAEQRRIAEILESSTESIRKTKQHIRAIEELKSSVFDSQISNCAKVVKPLGELCTQKPDYGIGAASEPFTEEKGRYLRITDITEQGGLNNVAVSPTGSVDELDPEKMIRPGDLLIARSGATVGKSYLHLAGSDASWFAGYLVRFRINQELIDPRIVFDFCHTEKFKAWIANRQQVAAQPNINAQIYAKELHIPIPDPTSAQKYLELRSHISMELDCLQKKVSLLKELHQSLSTRAFAGQL